MPNRTFDTKSDVIDTLKYLIDKHKNKYRRLFGTIDTKVVNADARNKTQLPCYKALTETYILQGIMMGYKTVIRMLGNLKEQVEQPETKVNTNDKLITTLLKVLLDGN